MNTKSTSAKSDNSTYSTQYRQRAEKLFREKGDASGERLAPLPEAEKKRLDHELGVHQIELELQNEELRRTQESLETEHRRYQELYDFAPVGYLTVDANSLITEANRTAATLLGMPKSALPRKPLTRFILPQDQDIFYRYRKMRLESGQSQAYELRVLREDGTWFWARLEHALYQDGDDQESCRIVLSDITRRRQAEEAMQRDKVLLERAMQLGRFGGWSVDLAENRIHFFGQTAAIHGLPEGFSPTVEEGLAFYAPQCRERITQVFKKCVREGVPFDEELEIIDKQGNSRWIRTIGEAIRDDSGAIEQVEGAFQDITQRIEADRIIAQKNTQLEISLAEKDKFFSILAHNLKAPLSGFLALTKLLSREFSSLPLKDLREMTLQLAQSSENMFNLLQNLLEWSLLQREMMPCTPTDCRLHELVDRNMELIGAAAQHKQITMQADIDEELHVYADRTMLDTIIRNLLSNAVKFCSAGDSVSISATRDQMVTVVVRDEGIGMEQQVLDNLFAQDQQFSMLGTGNETGTGLGMLLCHAYIQQQGGRIWVQSAPGEGAAFFFTLPATGPQHQAAAQES